MKFVYILESLDHPERHYTGMTGDVEARLLEHNSGNVLHTRKFAPWKLIVAIGFDDPVKAQRFETYLKSGSGRAFAKRHF